MSQPDFCTSSLRSDMERLQESAWLVYQPVEMLDKNVTSLQQYTWAVAACVALLLWKAS